MKMKSGKMSIKLNLLAILLMAALLVATLTSCGSQGEKGERGAKGDRGENGADGETPYIGENQNWWIGNVDTGVSVSGENGSNGVDGATPKFKFDETTHILSVSYDGVVWESLIDLSEAFLGGAGGSSGTNGIDGITPRLKIDADTNYWMVSYDNGITWESLGVKATGANGSNGQDGKDGKTPSLRINPDNLCWEVSYDGGASYESLNVPAKGADGKSAMLRINSTTFEWEVSYDGGENYTPMGVVAKGTNGTNGIDGKDGKTPCLKVENNKLYAFYEGESEAELLIDFSDLVVSGSDGNNGTDGTNGKDGRGISGVKIEGSSLVIYYTDGTHEVAGTLDGMVGVGGTSDTVDIYTDALDFYPINGGTEYGVKIGRAIYLERIEIPATYNGLPVTTILAEGFVSEDSSVLEEVIIPNSITKICTSAFSGCENITEIKIPASVTYIGKYAFVGVPTVYAEISESERPDGWSEEMGMDEIVWLG